MLKKTHSVLAMAAISAALPIAANAAVTIGYSFDPSITLLDLNGATLPSSTPGFSVSSSGSASAPNITVHVPLGDFLQVRLDGTVQGDTNTATAGTGPGGTVIPPNLGLASYQLGMTDSKSSIAVVENGGYWGGGVDTNKTTGSANAAFSSSAVGVLDGAGGVNPTTGVFGGNQPNNTGTSGAAATLSYAAGATPTDLYGPLYIGSADSQFTTAGTAVFSLLATAANQAYFTLKTDGTSGKSATAPIYQNTAPSVSDTINLGTLTVVVGGSSGSTTGTNKIISLSTTNLNGTAPNGYGTYPGAGQGTLTSVGGGQSATIHPASNVSGFVNLVNTANGYALLTLALNGTTLLPGDANLTTIAANIHTSDSTINPIVIPTTGSPLSQYASQGFDIAIPLGAASTFAYDFSSAAADFTDPGLAGVSVTAIAAVPEPATAAGVILGAAGLLLGRRKSKTA